MTEARPPAKRARRWRVIDAVVLLALAAGLAWIGHRAATHFQYHWDWARLPGYLVRYDADAGGWAANYLLLGFFTTIRLAIWAMLAACVIGVLMGIARNADNLFLRLVALSYVAVIRNMPPLVFIFIFYFFVSSQIMPILGLGPLAQGASPEVSALLGWLFGPTDLIENFAAGLLCLAMFEGAYITEIVRAGIQAIPKGQWDAGRSLGLGRWALMRKIILPQAIQKIAPPLAGQLISLIKDSSIVSLISVQELTFSGTEIANSSGLVYETWITVAILYFLLCFLLSRLFGRYEARTAAARS